MNRRQTLIIGTCLLNIGLSGCVSFFTYSEVDINIKVLNFTNLDKKVNITVYNNNSQTILDKNYTINARGEDQRSVPSIEENSFAKGTNGDQYEVEVSGINGGEGLNTGEFSVNCANHEDVEETFFIEIHQKGNIEYVDFEQSICSS